MLAWVVNDILLRSGRVLHIECMSHLQDEILWLDVSSTYKNCELGDKYIEQV